MARAGHKAARAAGAGLVAAGLVLGGCTTDGAVPFEAQQSGSLGIDRATGHLFVADQDNGGVAVIDPGNKAHPLLRFVKTGDGPERLVVHGDDVFVSNRRSRTVTQLSVTSQSVVRQIAVGAEPMGLKVSADGRTLVVANSMSGSVQAIDLQSFQTKWEARLGDEVRAVAFLPDGRVYAPAFKSGLLHVLDGETGRAVKQFSFAQPEDDDANFDRQPTLVQDVVVADDGHVYVPHSQTNKEALPPVVAGYYANGPAPAVAPGVTTVAYDTDTLLTEKQPKPFESPDPSETPFPATMLRPDKAFNGPVVAALDPSGQYLYVVNHLSNNVAVVSTTRRAFSDTSCCGGRLGSQGVAQLVPVGRGPNGIAISPDGQSAFVYNSFEHSVSVLQSDSTGGLVATTELAQITPDTLTPGQKRGRILFNDASDERLTLTAAGGVACASCHPGGREDGHTWQFAEGLRNTPSLVGKHLKDTRPYHWDGQFDEFTGFQHVLQKRMGGKGIEPAEFEDILEYLNNEPGPDNPFRAAGGQLTAQQQAGKQLFEGKAQCAACHTGALLTDNKFWDVGTALTKIPLDLDGAGSIVRPEDRQPAIPNTPSLLGIFATAPYLHDGTALSLEQRVRVNPGNKHGNTKDLTDDELQALVAYLQSL